VQASWQKWIPLSGILFVVLFIIGFVLAVGPETGTDQSDQEILDWYAKSSHQTLAFAGAYLLALAGVAMLLFVNRLRAVVSEAEGARPVFAPFILGSGVVFVVSVAVAGAAFAAVAAGVKFGNEPLPANADLMRFLPQLGYVLILILGMFPLIFAMLTTAYASMRHKIFASWFNWLTIVCGILLLFAAAFFPMIALGVWLIAASIVLMKHQPGTTAAA